MKIVEVTDKQTRKEFYNVARTLYKHDENWVCPLDLDLEGIFDPAENSLFKDGDAIRWVLRDDSGKTLGRVAAFYNHDKASKHEQPTGGLGFFECINDNDVAFMLFDACKNWLKEHGMEAMDGPITFGENITNWGLLVDGFTPPVWGMPYNFPYYKDLFEAYGFKTYYEEYSYEQEMAIPFPDRQVKFANHMRDKFQFEHFSFANQKKHLTDICTIYNAVWSDFHEDYTPLDYSEIEKMMKKAKPIINEKIIWFAYDNGKPIALVVVFPDVNQILKKLGNGQLNFWNMMKFLYYKKTGTVTRVRQFITAVIPEYQRSGVTGALFMTMVDAVQLNKYKTLDMSWVGDYNTTVNKIYRLLGIPIVKTHITYRYMFDPKKEVMRFTNIETEKAKRLKGEE
ncbi:MAG: GNAT family N-acetyltransferase [Bacteroidetes bacterium]|nr:GNAT family N-acetyltransferase [Bacteroidota bacterium]